MSRCLECQHLAPLARLQKGDPRELHVGQQGMLARGLVYCSLKPKGQTWKCFRPIDSRAPCPHFAPVNDPAKIEAREALAARLQEGFRSLMASLRKARTAR